MAKEIIISTIIILIIVTGDIITQQYTNNMVEDFKNELSILRENLTSKEYENNEESTNKLNKKREDFHKKLAYYIEHEELEKVETEIILLKSLIEMQRYDLAVGELDKMSFILEHIKDKSNFSLENIF